MTKWQWFVLQMLFIVMMVVFIGLDSSYNATFNYLTSPEVLTASDDLGIYDIWAVINSEIYEPFIWFCFMMSWVCMIMGWLEK